MIRQLLKENKLLVVDGATGSLLQALGMPAGASPADFCLERPDLVRDMHKAYLEAGADIILTPTFGGSPYKLPPGMDAVWFNRSMAQNARQVARELAPRLGRPLFVGGDMGPTGHFARPLGDAHPDELVAALREQVRGLVQGGVDLIFIETQFDLAEARAAVAAVRLECGQLGRDIPVFVSMTFEDGVSLTGSTPEIFAATMRNMGVDAVGVNCGAGPEQMLEVVERLIASCDLPVYAEPNAGLPELVDGETVFRLGAEEFAEKTALMAARGAQILGGCCGTTPEHIAALRRKLMGDRPDREACRVARPDCSGVCISSRSSLVRIGGNFPVALIGERINPTGKKQLSAELREGGFGLAMRYAAEQIEAGASILDVNVGVPGVDEEDFLPRLVEKLVSRHGTPLCLDSSNPRALVKALPWHPGSALINSISGEEDRMPLLAPLCRAWGLPFVLLPLRGAELPATAGERIAVIEELLAAMEAFRVPRHLVVVDALALTAASSPDAPMACLETIAWCASRGLPTTLGLSNISFGLPARDLVNSGFLHMAAGAGLSCLIGNPGNARLREALDTANLLLGRDPQAGNFISRYAAWKASEPSATAGQGAAGTTAGGSRELSLEQAVIKGEKEAIAQLVEKELAAGQAPYDLVQEKLIPALNEVGALYERKEYFLPQLLRSAETMQAAFAVVRPLLEKQGGDKRKTVIVIATVEGDIHDIGKNIVALMLGNHGYEVVDLGQNVKAERIVGEAERLGAKIICLSALMTTTMPRMEDSVKLVRSRGLACRIMIGGAVVTQDYAELIGADGYSDDAVGAVRLAARLLNS